MHLMTVEICRHFEFWKFSLWWSRRYHFQIQRRANTNVPQLFCRVGPAREIETGDPSASSPSRSLQPSREPTLSISSLLFRPCADDRLHPDGYVHKEGIARPNRLKVFAKGSAAELALGRCERHRVNLPHIITNQSTWLCKENIKITLNS